MRFKKSLVFALSLCFGFASIGMAQTGTGTISGQVHDVSGAVVPRATVQVTNVDTGITRTVQTNDVGVYVVPLLQPGGYTVKVEAQGFKPFVRTGVILQIDQNSRQDMSLEVGQSRQIVQVQATAEQFLKPATSDLGEVINREMIEELPLNGRNMNDLIALNAGVTTTTASFFKGVGVDLSLNGQRSSTNSFLIDGLDNVEFMGQSPNVTLPVDSIQEFNILTNNYSAEYGRSNAGVINVFMRSGTNQFHGTAFEFLRNDKLDATDFFTNRVGGRKSPFRFNQFGGTFGGPIIKDKTFFFADYQGQTTRTQNTAILSVPPVAWRTGDFSSLLGQGIQLYDPTDVNGMIDVFPNRAPFDGNIIPAEKQDPVAQALLGLYPVPNLPGEFLNYATPIGGSSNGHQADVKVDHHLNERNTLTARWDYNHLTTTADPFFGNVGGGGGLPYSTVEGQDVGASYTSILSANLVNEFRYGFTRRTGDLLPSGFGQDLNTQFGIPDINVDQNTSGLAFLGPSGYDALGGQVFFPQITGITSHEFLDNLSIVRGRHSIKLGGNITRRLLTLYQAGFPRGFFTFDNLATSQALVGGNSIASFLMGFPTFAQRDFLDHFIYQRGWEFGAFAQDEFRVNRRLTLNFGVRYDIFTPFVEANNRQANFNMATKTMELAGQDGNSRALVDTDKNNISPRVGFAYSLTSDGRTVLRAGYGMSYFAEQNALATLDRLTYNIPYYYLFTNFQFGGFTPTQTLTTMLPPVPPPDPNNPFGKVGYRVPDLQDSQVQFWNLDFQRAVTPSTVLDIAYAGSKGTHLLGIRNPNQPPPGPVQVFPVSPAIGLLFTMESRVNSSYNALQVKLNKRFTRGLAFLASYTYSHSIDNSVGYWPNSGISQLPQDSRNFGDAERGSSDWDIRHRFVVSYVWQLPVGRGKHFLAQTGPVTDAILGGWQMTGITTLNTGTPFTALISTNQANTAFGGALRPERMGSGSLSGSQRTVDQWFNTSAFALPSLFTFGNSGRNILTGPGLVNFDWGLFKNFRIRENLTLQFRSEFFNLFNTTHFGLPNAFIDLPQGGTINSLTTPPREIQFALKLIF